MVGVLLNQNGINRLDNRINSLEGRFNFLEGRFDALSKQLNDGIVMVIDRDTEKAERLARPEEKNNKS